MQVGACIVNQDNKIVGIGYNGMPNGCDDDLLPWSRSADDRLDTKYPYGEHACVHTLLAFSLALMLSVVILVLFFLESNSLVEENVKVQQSYKVFLISSTTAQNSTAVN